MDYRLLLVDGQGAVRVSELLIRTLREFPGAGGVSVHFRPVRNDRLFDSAKSGGGLAYRILSGEGMVRGQLWVEFEVPGEHQNVIGHSSDLLFALALITATWKPSADALAIAATGVLDAEGAVQPVERTVEKVAAAVHGLPPAGRSIVFYPHADAAAVEAWRAGSPPPAHIELRPVAHLDEALGQLGYTLAKVYLRNPFRGLEHFDFEHHPIFFGRDREVREVLAQLLRRESAGAAGLLVEGPSGSGKSSFLRAGVLPALVRPGSQPGDTRDAIARRPFHPASGRATWRPGLMAAGADEAAMVQSIVECWRVFPELRLDADDVPRLADLARKRRELWPKSHRFVWMIDQFEEIFSMGLDPALIDALGALLLQLQFDGAWTLAAVRADAMPRVKGSDAMRQVFGANEGQYYLAALRGTALDDVIALPAKAGKLEFETGADGKTLDAILREEAYREQDSLPQLQFTLNELYQRRAGNLLTFAAYRDLGGLSGSIAKAASAVLNSDEPDLQRAMPRVFRCLVSVDDTGRASRRYAALTEFAADPLQNRIVQRLVDSRLCVTDERDGEPVVAFAHDSLLSSLPVLTEWLQQEAGLLQTRELAQRETRLWQQHEESDDWLAASDKLVLFKTLEAAEVPLQGPVTEFVRRSQRRVRRAKLLRQTAIGAIALLALVATGAAWIAVKKQQEAEYQALQTAEAQSRSLTETAAARLNAGDVDAAQDIAVAILARPAGASSAAAVSEVFHRARASDQQLLGMAVPGRVRRVSFSADGRKILAAIFDGTVRVWDVATGRPMLVLRGHTGPVYSAAFSPDGERIVSASQDLTARVWDVESGRELMLLSGHTARVTWAEYSRDASLLLTASMDGTVRIWDASSGKLRSVLNSESGTVSAAAFSPDGKWVAATAVDGITRIWDVRTARQVRQLSKHIGPVYGVGFSPDGSRLATAAADGMVRIWDAATGKQLFLLSGHTDRIAESMFSPDGTLVVSASADGTARIWEAMTGQEALKFQGHSDWVFSAEFSPDGKQIATASADHTIRLWDLDAAAVGETRALKADFAIDSDVNFSPDGTRVIAMTGDKTVVVWDIQTARQVMRITNLESTAGQVEFSPDGRRILASSEKGVPRIWDADTGTLLLRLEGHTLRVPTATYSRDGKRIASISDDKTVRLWDAETGRPLHVLTGHSAAVNDADFSNDGRQLATSSVDKSVRLWDVEAGRQVRVLNGHTASVYCVEFSPDGRHIVSGSHDSSARVWDAKTGEQVWVLAGHVGTVTGVDFSPDGKLIATAGDTTVRLWDAASGRLLAVKKFVASVGTVSFSPDGRLLASSLGDRTVRLWSPVIEPVAVQMAYVVAAQFEPLTQAERFHLGLADSEIAKPGDFGKCLASVLPPSEAQPLPLDRLDPAVPYSSAAACDNRQNEKGRANYKKARGMLEEGDFPQARRELEAAISNGYVPAKLDLAMLVSRPAGKMLDVARAIELYEQAWKDGLVLAGFELAALHEQETGAEEERAWEWYRRAADAGEPHALARFGDRARDAAYTETNDPKRRALMLESFRYFAAASEVASTEDWPDDAWRDWRYHRATLARLLARQGMMREVAEASVQVRKQYSPQAD